jgi:DNA-directed RNA polymerase specialized sigma24 family protein
MGQHVSDDALIAAVQQGDATAFTQLVQRHWAWVWQLITAIVHDHAYAEDVARPATIHKLLLEITDESSLNWSGQ